MLPHAFTHVECFSDAMDHDQWIDLEKDSSVGPVLSKPASSTMAAPDVQHAWAFDAADCSGKDLVGNMDGKLMNGLTCDNDGLTLNFGNSASNGD